MTLTRSRPLGAPTVATAPRAFGILALVLAATLLLNTLLGPVGVGLADYAISPSLLNQLVGLEVVTVLLVVPVLVWGALWSLRGRPAGPLLVTGPAGYAAYMFVQYVLGPEYGTYSLLVLFHLALVTLSGALAVWSWMLSARTLMPATSRRTDCWQGVLLIGFATFVVTRYAAAFTGALDGAPIAAEFADARTFYWSIFLMDLGIVVPLSVLAGVAAMRGGAVGRRAVHAVTGWFALVPPSVASMAVVMLVRDDPHASSTTVVVLGTASLVFLGVAVAVFRPLLRQR